MSLARDGFWKAGFWATNFWADGFWAEGAGAAQAPTPVGRPVIYLKGRRRKARTLESAQQALKRVLAVAEAEIMAVPVPKAVPQEVAATAKSQLLPLRVVAASKALDTASISKQLATVRAAVVALEKVRWEALLEEEEELLLLAA